MPRRGFTLLELLIAGALGVVILALGMQQVMAYMRVQQSLMARAELRAGLNLGLSRMAGRLRGAIVVEPLTNELLAIQPLDDNHDGVLGPGDRMLISDWRLAAPFPTGNAPVLQERDVTVPAFIPPSDPTLLISLFQATLGQAHTLAPAVNQLEALNLASGLWQIKLTGSRSLPHTPLMTVSVNQWVTQRETLVSEGLPSFEVILSRLRLTP
jgi:prepilin-type N-terminal cleavage/methylation domain-containing protein